MTKIINKKLFEKIVTKTQEQLKPYLASSLVNLGYRPISRNGFLYAEGKVPVLLVAHMDTVHKEQVQNICWDKKDNVVMSPQGIGGDDRCGVYMILSILKDINCHVLFCEDEEIGCVGARKFTAQQEIFPSVNCIIEFDRKGSNDAVFYDCANKDFTDFVCAHGFMEAIGIYSDISIIAPHLGVAAVNLSCGYYNAHTTSEYVVSSQMEANIEYAKALINDCIQRYEYIEAAPVYKSWGHYGGSYRYGSTWGYDDDDDDFLEHYYKTFKLDDPEKKNNEKKHKNSRYVFSGYADENHQEIEEEPEIALEPLMPLSVAREELLVAYDNSCFCLSPEAAEYFAIDDMFGLYSIKDNGTATRLADSVVICFSNGDDLNYVDEEAMLYELV